MNPRGAGSSEWFLRWAGQIAPGPRSRPPIWMVWSLGRTKILPSPMLPRRQTMAERCSGGLPQLDIVQPPIEFTAADEFVVGEASKGHVIQKHVDRFQQPVFFGRG